MVNKPKQNENPLLAAALDYHHRGWSIIPISYGTKKARFKWAKCQIVRPDEKQLQKWFANGNRNIAVVLGEVSSGLACRDFDTMTEYRLWASSNPEPSFLMSM